MNYHCKAPSFQLFKQVFNISREVLLQLLTDRPCKVFVWSSCFRLHGSSSISSFDSLIKEDPESTRVLIQKDACACRVWRPSFCQTTNFALGSLTVDVLFDCSREVQAIIVPEMLLSDRRMLEQLLSRPSELERGRVDDNLSWRLIFFSLLNTIKMGTFIPKNIFRTTLWTLFIAVEVVDQSWECGLMSGRRCYRQFPVCRTQSGQLLSFSSIATFELTQPKMSMRIIKFNGLVFGREFTRSISFVGSVLLL